MVTMMMMGGGCQQQAFSIIEMLGVFNRERVLLVVDTSHVHGQELRIFELWHQSSGAGGDK